MKNLCSGFRYSLIVWVPAWKKIWKPVVISEWFPSPDHHDHHEHHEHHELHEHPEHGWDRKDKDVSDSKVVWKREQPSATLPKAHSTQNPNISKILGNIQPKVATKVN